MWIVDFFKWYAYVRYSITITRDHLFKFVAFFRNKETSHYVTLVDKYVWEFSLLFPDGHHILKHFNYVGDNIVTHQIDTLHELNKELHNRTNECLGTTDCDNSKFWKAWDDKLVTMNFLHNFLRQISHELNNSFNFRRVCHLKL